MTRPPSRGKMVAVRPQNVSPLSCGRLRWPPRAPAPLLSPPGDAKVTRKGQGAMRFPRGFRGRGEATRDRRLPPGQYDVGSAWPVLTAEATPRLSTDTWTFKIRGLVEQPTTWSGDEIHALAPSTFEGAIHCVTTWSKLGATFSGAPGHTPPAPRRPRPPPTPRRPPG